jgi:5-methylcytosine-specific restriction endonuclease McrA
MTNTATNSFSTFTIGKSARTAHQALKTNLYAMDQAHGQAILWYADIQNRGLFRKLGFSSMNMYARQALGFSETKAGDFSNLSRRLADLPLLRAALQNDAIGYTKARLILPLCSPSTESQWVETACNQTRRQLELLVKAARRESTLARKHQPEFLIPENRVPEPATESHKTERPQTHLPGHPRHQQPTPTQQPALPAAVPIRQTLEFTPEQYALYETLLEKSAKCGRPLPSNRTAALLEILASYVETIQTKTSKTTPRGENLDTGNPENEEAGQGYSTNPAPPFQIHVHHCPTCASTMIPTSKGNLTVTPATYGRATCDARISKPDRPNSATIPPSIRRMVLARDGHRCRRPGCNHTRFLEVHHLVPRALGGSNQLANLITLCSACHQLLHEKRWAADQLLAREESPPYAVALTTPAHADYARQSSQMARLREHPGRGRKTRKEGPL